MRKILILLVLAIAVFFLPQIVSTFGTKFIDSALSKKFHADISIRKIHLSWFGPQTFQNISFSHPELKGEIESVTSNLHLWSFPQFGNDFTLKNGLFTLTKYHNIQIGPIQAEIAKHEINATGNASEGGRFSIHGKLYSKSDFDLVANFDKMPSAAIDPLLGANGFFLAAVGSTFDLASSIAYNGGEGILKVQFSSPHFTSQINGQIAQDTLLLKDPLLAELWFSPELSQKFEGRILKPHNPITLRIETAGASFPIDIDKWEIGKGSLDLGQIVCTKIPPLISLFALLNRAGIVESTATVWFTPVNFSLHQGDLQVDRVDALIGSAVHLCAWGEVKIPSGALDAKLGIPSDTLSQTLDILNLSRNYVLQIPIRGTIVHPKYDIALAATKIAALIAGRHIPYQNSKKAKGLLKGFLNQMNSTKEESEAPPPNRPFPWE